MLIPNILNTPKDSKFQTKDPIIYFNSFISVMVSADIKVFCVVCVIHMGQGHQKVKVILMSSSPEEQGQLSSKVRKIYEEGKSKITI